MHHETMMPIADTFRGTYKGTLQKRQAGLKGDDSYRTVRSKKRSLRSDTNVGPRAEPEP